MRAMPKTCGPKVFSPSRYEGFTLIEVVVSAFILAIGMLGLAALQGKGMRFAINAYYTSQAALMASDMSDRIRANKAGLNFYTNGGAAIAGTNNNCMSDENGGAASNCTPAQMAANDIFHWKAYVASGMPSGSGQVIFSAAATTQVNYFSVAAGATVATPAVPALCPAQSYLITIAWNLRNFNTAQGNGNNPDQTYTLCLTNP